MDKSPYVTACLACDMSAALRHCVCIPADHSRSSPEGATDNPRSQQKTLRGGGLGWEKHRCTLLFRSPPSVPFCSFSIQWTLASRAFHSGSAPHSPNRFTPQAKAAAVLSSLIVFRLPPQRPRSAQISPCYASGQLRNHGRGHGGQSCWNSHTQIYSITHMHTHTREHALPLYPIFKWSNIINNIVSLSCLNYLFLILILSFSSVIL